MKYKGYTGVVEFDESSNVLFGRVVGLRDVITFQGESVAEVTQAFHDSVDVYLEFCTERGKSPEKPYSGKFVLRVGPDLHRAITHAAEVEKVSLNTLVESVIERALHLYGSGRLLDPISDKTSIASKRSRVEKTSEFVDPEAQDGSGISRAAASPKTTPRMMPKAPARKAASSKLGAVNKAAVSRQPKKGPKARTR